MGSEGEVSAESKQVLRVVAQFLDENGLTSTLKKLQEESGVANLSTLPPSTRTQVRTAISGGNWVVALELLKNVQLSPRVSFPNPQSPNNFYTDRGDALGTGRC